MVPYEQIRQQIGEVRSSMDRIEGRLQSVEQRLHDLERQSKGTGAALPAVPDKKLSLREFLRKVEPRSYPEKTLAVLFHQEIVRQQGGAALDHIRAGYRRAKERLPRNLSDSVYKCVKRGWLMEIPDAEERNTVWEVTATGIEEIRNRLGEEGFELP